MKSYIEILELLNREQNSNLEKSTLLVKDLYFSHIRSFFRSLKWSEEYKVTEDLIELRKQINFKTLEKRKFKSTFIKQLVDDHVQDNGSLDDANCTLLLNEVFEPNKYYISSIMVADSLKKEIHKDFRRWIMATSITIIIAAAGLLTAYSRYLAATC